MKKLLFIILLIPVQVLLGQEKGLTPVDIAKLEYVSSAKINNEGSKIGYTVVKQADPTKENSSASLKLWMYDVKSGTSNPSGSQACQRG